jgi:hypothetical protein
MQLARIQGLLRYQAQFPIYVTHCVIYEEILPLRTIRIVNGHNDGDVFRGEGFFEDFACTTDSDRAAKIRYLFSSGKDITWSI